MATNLNTSNCTGKVSTE